MTRGFRSTILQDMNRRRAGEFARDPIGATSRRDVTCCGVDERRISSARVFRNHGDGVKRRGETTTTDGDEYFANRRERRRRASAAAAAAVATMRPESIAKRE